MNKTILMAVAMLWTLAASAHPKKEGAGHKKKDTFL